MLDDLVNVASVVVGCPSVPTATDALQGPPPHQSRASARPAFSRVSRQPLYRPQPSRGGRGVSRADRLGAALMLAFRTPKIGIVREGPMAASGPEQWSGVEVRGFCGGW